MDLIVPSLRFLVSKKKSVNEVAKDRVIPSTKIMSFTQRYDCFMGINTNPFDALVFYRDGRTAIVKQAALGRELDTIVNAVGDFPLS